MSELVEKNDAELHKSPSAASKADTTMTTDSGNEGHTRQMRVTFNLWSTLGLVYSITATPLGVGSYLTFSLILGGSPFYIYGYIFAVSLNIILCVALAEIASMYPHPSGHIYWVGKLAPQKWALCLSYWTGVLTSAAWFFWNAGTYLLTAQIFLASVMVRHPDYVQEPWHAMLVAWLQAIISVIWNIPLFKTWPYTLKGMVIITNVGVLYLAISLLVRTNPKQSAHSVFVEVINESGWASSGVVFFLGLLPGTTAINGFDSASHMVEEMPDPARQVPQVMVGNALLSGFLGLPMTIIFCFCIVNRDNLLAPVGGVTVIQIFKDSLNSDALFVISSILYVVVTLVAATAVTTTCSRVWWSFSTHHGLPFSSWFSVINTTAHWAVPANAILTIAATSCLVLLLNLGPSFVLAALFSTGNICFYLSYFITIVCFLKKKWQEGLPPHYFNLGGLFGNVICITGAIWSIFASVWLLFPYYLSVTPLLMNYSVVVLAIPIVLFSVDWTLRARKSYIIPSPLIIS